ARRSAPRCRGRAWRTRSRSPSGQGYAEPRLGLVGGQTAVVAAEAALVARVRAQPRHPAGCRKHADVAEALLQARADVIEELAREADGRSVAEPRRELVADALGIVDVQEAVARRTRGRVTQRQLGPDVVEQVELPDVDLPVVGGDQQQRVLRQ